MILRLIDDDNDDALSCASLLSSCLLISLELALAIMIAMQWDEFDTIGVAE